MKSSLKAVFRRCRGTIVFLGLVFAFKSAVADVNYVPSSSMNPTIWAGDRVVVNKLAYSLRVPFTLQEVARWSHPARGDIVTFDSPRDGANLIKRVVAVGGDVVEMRANVLYVNDLALSRELVSEETVIPTEFGPMNEEIWRERRPEGAYQVARIPTANKLRDFPPIQVPAGKVMVMGDNRDNSFDSRFFGFVPEHTITGKAVVVAMSHDPLALYLPRASRLFIPLGL